MSKGIGLESSAHDVSSALVSQVPEQNLMHGGLDVWQRVVATGRRRLSIAGRAGVAGLALTVLAPGLAVAAETTPPEELTITNSCDDVAKKVEIKTVNNTDHYIYAIRYDLFGNGSSPESSKKGVVADGDTIRTPVYPYDEAPFPTSGKRIEATVVEAADRNTGTISSHRPPKVSTVIDRSNCSGGKAPVTPGGIPLNKPIVGIASTSTGNGYNLVASDGGVFSFGDAQFKGSLGGIALDKPVVGIAPTPSGNGYNLVASDGGVFSFGDANFKGSLGGIPLSAPITGMSRTSTGNGYNLVASDGGVFSFGDAQFKGSLGGVPLIKPVVAIANTPTDGGYVELDATGNVTAFGDGQVLGSANGGAAINGPAVGLASTSAGDGFFVAANNGSVSTYGNARFQGGIVLSAPILGTPPTQP